jgi:uncharacterized protein YqgV (UPF0045/DUF77 family)
MLEFAMFPTDKGVSVSNYVSRIIKMIDKSGASYQLNIPLWELLLSLTI